MRASAWTVLVALWAVPACSLARSPLLGRSDGGRVVVDAASLPDAAELPDTPEVPPVDAPAPPLDAPPADAGCVPNCTGSVLGGCGAALDCALSGLVCGADPGGRPACVPPPCIGDEPTCSGDGRASLACLGGTRAPVWCDGYGCDGSTGACDDTCNVTGEYVPGTTRFDLCDYGADYQNATVTGACNARADGEDRMARLVVTRRSHLEAVVHDDDPAVNVDTVLYLWGVCDDEATQIACDDDVPCAEAPSSIGGCFDGNQWRQSHIAADLEPGIYYLVADSIDTFDRGVDWVCGNVALDVTLTPL